jgi:hypothetical protein
MATAKTLLIAFMTWFILSIPRQGAKPSKYCFQCEIETRTVVLISCSYILEVKEDTQILSRGHTHTHKSVMLVYRPLHNLRCLITGPASDGMSVKSDRVEPVIEASDWSDAGRK